MAGIVPALALPSAIGSVVDPIIDTAGTAAGACDPIDPAHCLLPFPNDYFTVEDNTTVTGRRINLSPLAMPRNVAGKPIDPTEWNRNDGFSPGAMVITYVPGIDLKKTWGTDLDQIQDLELSTGAKAPIAIIDAETGQRHPFWSELDTHPDTTDDRRTLLIRPAINFEEGRRYIVALRNLKDASGNTIPRGEAFDAFVKGTATGERAEQMNAIFEDLESVKGKGRQIKRDELYLAWDFTVASADNIAGRVLHMRDTSFAELRDYNLADRRVEGVSPTFTITNVDDDPSDGNTLRRIDGTITVPNFLTHDAEVEPNGDGYEAAAAPGSRLLYLDGDDLPDVNPAQQTLDVPFVCNIPDPVYASGPAHPLLYGHGLLGARQESSFSSTHDLRKHNFAPCAVDWMGMSFSDLANVATILPDASNFPSLADRAQQGFLNWMFLGRALLHEDGLGNHPAFKDYAGNRLLATGELFYNGNSQGGIMGGALTALSPDFTMSILGVPGMNYSTLLNRSVDWEGDFDAAAAAEEAFTEQDPEELVPPYSYPMYRAYEDKLEQQIVFALIQMIWDRAESNGYAHHMTDDPYPNTPSHQVMLQVAFSDHQVANIAAEVMGRTIGAQLTNAAMPVPDKLHWSVDPSFGFENSLFETPGLSHLVYWHSTDRGLTTPPNGNTPPHMGEDPHSDPRKDFYAVIQEVQFLLEGTLKDVCGGTACVTTRATRDQ